MSAMFSAAVLSDGIVHHPTQRWAAFRQHHLEGGFQGRTNKLVDSCYSYWVGGLFPLLHTAIERYSDTEDRLQRAQKEALSVGSWMFDQLAVQRYILLCCQIPRRAGLRDKPDV